MNLKIKKQLLEENLKINIMNRIKFIKTASKYFNTTLDPKVFDGLMHYSVSGFKYEWEQKNKKWN